MKEKERIFISYAHIDSDFVHMLVHDLGAYEVNVWVDKRDIPAGVPWPQHIQTELQNSAKLLVVLSPDSVASHWVNNEIVFALNAGKPVIPVFLRDCPLPLQLQTIQYMDFRQTAWNRNRYDEELQRLLQSLQPPSKKKTSGGKPLSRIPPPFTPISLRAIPELFIKNIFAIPEENSQRDLRMQQLLMFSSKPVQELRLLARTGFNYLHSAGHNYQAGFGHHLRTGTKIRVLLENPYSQLAVARLRAAPVTDRWDKLPSVRIRRLLDLYSRNLVIRFTENPVYCSLFFTFESVIYDPYHLGKLGSPDSVGNQFLVFEFGKPSQEKRLGPLDYYALLEDHFNFLWDDRTKTFDELCAEHPEDLGRFTAPGQGPKPHEHEST